MRSILTAVLVVLFAACAPVYKHDIQFNPNEPLRTAVMPFMHVGHDGKPLEKDLSLLIDNISLVSSRLSVSPAEYVRRAVQSELSKTALDVLAPGLIDARLSHGGFTKQDFTTIDTTKVFAASPAEICGKLLQCDAVLFGKVSRWDRSYYGVQSVNSVGIDLALVRASDGKVLFSTHGEDSESRGLTKGPTGFSDLVLEPIKGLDNQIITNLAAKVVAQMIAPLSGASRPEYLKSAPPAIFASAHDAQDGRLPKSGRLTVLVYGSPKQSASFSVGSLIQNLPMAEIDGGHYIGEYLPLPGDALKDAPVYASLTDEFGRTTRQRVGASNVTLGPKK